MFALQYYDSLKTPNTERIVQLHCLVGCPVKLNQSIFHCCVEGMKFILQFWRSCGGVCEENVLYFFNLSHYICL